MSTQAATEELAVVIGLEVHVQLETETKIFCGCSTDPPGTPNSNTCPVCLGLPGALPVLNEAAVVSAVKLGKAVDATIPEQTSFDRKNYFYPDLTKGFQLTQYGAPICQGGALDIELEGDRRSIRLRRAHLEEDPGSLEHVGGTVSTAEYTLVDYNRAGMPLMEIVTEPDLRSAPEVRAFLAKLTEVLEYLGIFDSQRDGSLRVDANVSLVPETELSDDGEVTEDALENANRTEVKNISSHKGAQQALAYEVTRQRNAIQRGTEIETETRHWDESRGITVSMRTKEAEADYRYFPEGDLPPLSVSDWREQISIPELPDARRERFRSEYDLDEEAASKLTSSKQVADFYESVAEEFDPALAATWVADLLLGELNYRDRSITDVEHRLEEFTRLIETVDSGAITSKNAEEVVLREMLDEGRSPEAIIEAEGLGTADDGEVETAVSDAIEENPDAVADYREGQDGAINFLVGQVMQKTGGSADPGDVNAALRAELESLPE